MEKLLLTIPEVAKALGVGKDTAYKLVSSGQLQALKLGSLKVRRAEVERFLLQAEGYDYSDPYNVQALK